MRNWLIGCYIAEYELRGSDRARYGDRLFARLSFRLQKSGVSRSEERELRRYRRFYLLYPSIRESLTPELENRLLGQATNVALAIRESATPKSSAKDLIAKLSFTHIAQLIALDDEQKRSFYETECIQGGWSVRELKRQIASPNPPAPPIKLQTP